MDQKSTLPPLLPPPPPLQQQQQQPALQPKTKGRMRGTTISKPIVYGNVTYALPQLRGKSTHVWGCYVRGLNNEDLSPLIKHVEFLLHPTFERPKRVVESPGPFAISEYGWGEFTVIITLHFVDEIQERPLQLSHSLALYDAEHPPTSPDVVESRPLPYTREQFLKPIVVERYDEIVFRDPTEELHARLTAPPQTATSVQPRGELAELLAPVFNPRKSSTFSDETDLKRIRAASAVVSSKLQELNARFAELESAEVALKEELSKQQK